MTSALPWRLIGWANPDSAANNHWKRLAQAALATPYYSQASWAGLLKLSSDLALKRLPPLELAEFYARFREFENPSAAPAPPQPLAAPWKAAARTVAIAPWFHLEPEIAIVGDCDAPDLAVAECIAAPVELLRELSSSVLRGRRTLPNLRYGVIAFIGVGRPLVSLQDRETLWRAFRAPLFEQFRGFHGELLARECERHDGLHIDAQAAAFEQLEAELALTSLANLRYPVLRLATGITGLIEESPCGCGSTAPRLSRLTLLGNRRTTSARIAS